MAQTTDGSFTRSGPGPGPAAQCLQLACSGSRALGNPASTICEGTDPRLSHPHGQPRAPGPARLSFLIIIRERTEVWERNLSRAPAENIHRPDDKLVQPVLLGSSPQLAVWEDVPGRCDPGLTRAAGMEVTALQPCKADQTCAQLNSLIEHPFPSCCMSLRGPVANAAHVPGVCSYPFISFGINCISGAQQPWVSLYAAHRGGTPARRGQGNSLSHSRKGTAGMGTQAVWLQGLCPGHGTTRLPLMLEKPLCILYVVCHMFV